MFTTESYTFSSHFVGYNGIVLSIMIIIFSQSGARLPSILRRLIWLVNWAKLITKNWSLHLNPMACLLPLYLFTHLSNSYFGMIDIIWANTVCHWFMISAFCNMIYKRIKSNFGKIIFVYLIENNYPKSYLGKIL